MIQNYNRYKILKVFIDSPLKNFHGREISRITKIAQPSVINHLKALQKNGLVLREKKGVFPSFISNRDNILFQLYKKIDTLLNLQETGLIDYINDTCMPSVIVLYGSASRGEDIENSDIDLFVESPETKLDLKKYEKLLKREISIFFEEDFSRLSKELKNNIINGVVLKGYIKVFK